MSQLIFDVRIGLRLICRNPGFSAAMILILALGIGASTAMFSLAHSLLLRPLPYPNPEQLAVLRGTTAVMPSITVSGQDFLDWKAQADAFSHMAAVQYRSLGMTSDNRAPEYVAAAGVTADFFPLLGIHAARGRLLNFDDVKVGRDHVVVVSDALWRQRFGGDSALIGRTLSLEREPYTVIGILPPGFRFSGPRSDGADFWIPLVLSCAAGDATHPTRGDHYLDVLGRLRSGTSIGQGEAQMNSIAARLEATYPDTNSGVRVQVLSLHETLVGRLRPSVLMLFAAINIVLFIVCANLANLLLSRAVARNGEIAMRHALGASRWCIVRQLLTESLLLSLLGGIAGMALALWAVDFFAAGLVSRGAGTIPVELNSHALLFAVGVCLFTGILFGLAPALVASRVDLHAVLKEGAARGSEAQGRRRLRNALVVAEVALALVLLVGGGVTLKSFLQLYKTDVGFETRNSVVASIVLPGSRYANDDAVRAFFSALLERLGGLPNVTSVAATSNLPLSGVNVNGDFQIEGRVPWRPGEGPQIEKNVVVPGYFRTMGIPLVRGREFDERDGKTGREVIIINENAAKRFFPNEDPIGKRISLEELSDPEWKEIVGVVRDVRNIALEAPIRSETYVPHTQHPERRMGIVIRTAQTDTVMRSLAGHVQAIDPEQPVLQVRTYEQLVSNTIRQQRYNVILFSAFALAALGIAAIGIFSVVSYSTSQRTREIGIRVALGARPTQVLRLVMRQAGAMIVFGLLLGMAGSLGAGHAMAKLIAGAIASDPTILATSSFLLAATAALACLIPAWRATRISPATALRHE